MRAPLELVFMFPQSGAAEVPKYQVMIQVNLASGYLHPRLPVRLQTCCNLAAEASEEALVMRGIMAHGDSCVDKPPHICQYPCVIP